MTKKLDNEPFVIDRLKIGSTKFSIYSNNKSYTLVWYENGRRIRKTFKTIDEAKRQARTAKATKSNNTLSLSGKELNEYRATLDILNSYANMCDLPERPRIDTLIQEAITIRKQKPDNYTVKTTSEVFEELKAQKITNGCTRQTILDMGCLKSFINMYPSYIHEISNQDVIEWNNLIAKGKAERTRANYQNALINLFNYAQNMEYLPDGKHSAHVLKKAGLKAKKGVAEVKLWGINEWERIINKSLELKSVGENKRVTIMVALAGLAGLRTSEIARMVWSDVLWDTKYIRVPAHKSKNNKAHRRIPLSPSLEAWLRLAGGAEESTGSMTKVKDRSYVTERIVQTTKRAGLEHINNGLRHSCISAWIAQGNEIGTVSNWADNSPAIIRSNYLGEITQEDGERWHSIMPPRRSD
tara:strand:+ start:3035 stop:4270 length:1236 start_codon:yes stop_codon:yes gene_type:complete